MAGMVDRQSNDVTVMRVRLLNSFLVLQLPNYLQKGTISFHFSFSLSLFLSLSLSLSAAVAAKR